MRVFVLLASATAPILSAAAAKAESERFLSVPLRSATIPASVGRARARARDLPYTNLVDITNTYIADIAVGFPPQPLNLIIDSGSSSLWVNPSCEYALNPRLCQAFPRYNPDRSDTPPKRVPALDRYQDYASGSWALVTGYSEVVWLNEDTSIPNQAFGLANETDGAFLGFLGLGPDLATGFDSQIANYSILNNLASQGLINSRTYSIGFEKTLTLNSNSPKALVFGGIDKNKYKGKFFSLPVQLPGKGGGDNYWRFWVQLTGVTHTLANGTTRPGTTFTGRNSTYIMDTGTTGVYLPRDVVREITTDLKLDWKAGSFPSISCNRATEKGFLTFTFGQRTITVPYSTLVLENTPGSCLFLVTSVESDAVDLHILGLGFMRAAYTAFDWDNKEVFLAERADCGEDADLVAIPAKPGAVLAIEGHCK